jgi:transposase
MKDCNRSTTRNTIGVDLSDRFSYFFTVDRDGNCAGEGRVPTGPTAFRDHFGRLDPALVAIETGTHSPWASRVLAECGHEVLVANARELRLIYQNKKKTDREDAENLARTARLDPKLLHPVEHRSVEDQQNLAVLRARFALVSARTELIQHVRGAVKSFGARIAGHSAEAFHFKARGEIPTELEPALVPVLTSIGELTARIREYDKVIEGVLSQEKYPHTKRLRQVPGVGPITALAFVLTLGDPRRFPKSRTVGAYLGLTPRRADTGESSPQLRISKAGDNTLRRLLVGSAQYILGPFGTNNDLRRFGHAIARRGGKNAKKRAAVAVARKLAVLLHRLWITGEDFRPLRTRTAPKGLS